MTALKNSYEKQGECSLDLNHPAKGDSIVLPGFASISVKKRAARAGRNPSTGKPINIPESNAISFKAGTKLKEAINS